MVIQIFYLYHSSLYLSREIGKASHLLALQDLYHELSNFSLLKAYLYFAIDFHYQY